MSDLSNELRRLAPLDHSRVLGDVMRQAADEIERLTRELTETGAQSEWRAQEIERLHGDIKTLNRKADHGCVGFSCKECDQ